MKTLDTFAIRLKDLRTKEGLTQQDLAVKFNISKQTISNYENNERTLNIATLLKISKHFNVSVDYLTGCSDIKDNLNTLSKQIIEKQIELQKLVNKINRINGILDEK